MRKFVFTNATGEPVRVATLPDEAACIDGNVYGDLMCREVPIVTDEDEVINTWYWKNGWKQRQKKDPELYIWNLETEDYHFNIDNAKKICWLNIKLARSTAEYAGFTWDGSTFDSDAVSQNRITGAVTLAMLSSTFVIDWVLADNTTRSLNQIDMMMVGGALGQHVATVFSKAVALRAAIEAATTQAEVEAVVWDEPTPTPTPTPTPEPVPTPTPTPEPVPTP